MDIETLYEIINQSDLTLIGYTYKDERLKDALLSRINPMQVGRVKASFDIKQHLRDVKIDEVLSNKPFYNSKLLLIDLSDVDTGENEDGNLYKAKALRRFVENLRSQCVIFGYKAIMTSPLYQTISNGDTPIHNFMGGSSPMYASDLVIKFEDGAIKVIKNRYGKDNLDISSDKLKKMLYI